MLNVLLFLLNLNFYFLVIFFTLVILGIFSHRVQGWFIFLHWINPIPNCVFPINKFWKPEDAEALSFTTQDHHTLGAWFFKRKPSSSSSSSPVIVLYLHGNAASRRHFRRIRSVRSILRLLDADGLLMLDYRGFGDSPGTPSEPGLIQDALAAYALCLDSLGASSVVVWGHSLGSGVATGLCAALAGQSVLPPPRCVLLEAPFLSIPHAALSHWVGIPLRLLPKSVRERLLERVVHRFESHKIVRQGLVKCPLMILHCRDDRVIDVQQGISLHQLAEEAGMQCKICLVDGAGHNGVTFSPIIQEPIRNFLQSF